MVVDGDQVGYDGIRPATQVGPRRVEACLGGHDDGDSRVDEGVEKTSILFRKRDDRYGQNFAYPEVSQTFKVNGRVSPMVSHFIFICSLFLACQLRHGLPFSYSYVHFS